MTFATPTCNSSPLLSFVSFCQLFYEQIKTPCKRGRAPPAGGLVADPRDRNIPTTFSADLQRHGGEETWGWGEILYLRTVIVAAFGGG